MGKVSRINKSRKEHKCSKCGCVIEKGSPYLKGELNFHPDIVRCTKCGLQSWEVTTSDYVRSAGAIVNRWRADYGCCEEGLESIISDIEELRDQCQENLDNMPESLQYAPAGETLQGRIDSLESALSDLENIDISEIKDEIASATISDVDHVFIPEGEDEDFDTIVEHNEDLADDMVDEYESQLGSAIEEALSNIEY